MPAVITLEKLTKSYGSHRGILDVDLAVEQGEIFGFLGPNGARKTTTIRTMLDLIRPTSGRALVSASAENAHRTGAINLQTYLDGQVSTDIQCGFLATVQVAGPAVELQPI